MPLGNGTLTTKSSKERILYEDPQKSFSKDDRVAGFGRHIDGRFVLCWRILLRSRLHGACRIFYFHHLLRLGCETSTIKPAQAAAAPDITITLFQPPQKGASREEKILGIRIAAKHLAGSRSTSGRGPYHPVVLPGKRPSSGMYDVWRVYPPGPGLDGTVPPRKLSAVAPNASGTPAILADKEPPMAIILITSIACAAMYGLIKLVQSRWAH